MFLKLVTILFLLISYILPDISAQGPLHTNLKIRTDESNNFHPVTVLGEKIHLWEKEYRNNIRIHIFDKRLNLLKQARIQIEKGLLDNIVFTSFHNFYYAFVFTKIENDLSIQLLKVDGDGNVSILKLPEVVPALINVSNKLHIEKYNDDILLFHRLPAGNGVDRSILIQRFDSSMFLLDDYQVYTPISKSLDLVWKISDDGIIYFAGTCVNNNVENVLVVEKVNLIKESAVRNEFLCGNNEFSYLNLFHNNADGLVKIFCVEDRKMENSVDSSNLIVSVFTLNERLSLESEPETIQTTNVSGQSNPYSPQSGADISGSLLNSFDLSDEEFRDRSHQPYLPNPFMSLEHESVVPTYSQNIKHQKQSDYSIHISSASSNTMHASEKLIINSNHRFRLYYNEPATKNRHFLKCIEIEPDLQFQEKSVVADPRYYYLLNRSVRLKDGRYLVPYKQNDLLGLSIHSF